MRTLKILMILFAVTLPFTFFTSRPVSTTEASTQKNRNPKPDDSMTECGPLDSLDRLVQERFRQTDKRFGITRMKPDTLHVSSYFVPETPEESRVVQELVNGGWQVFFYLTGRRILSYDPKPADSNPDRNKIVSGPLPLTAFYDHSISTEMSGLPKRYELMDHAKNAMIVFDKKDEYNFKIGRWTFVARPIRAQENCLRCHNNAPPEKVSTPRVRTFTNDLELYRDHARSNTPIKVGDALGVAIYAYARTKQDKK
jgi:hypothetical protein